MDEKQTFSCYNCQNQDLKLVHNGCRDNQRVNVLMCKRCGLLFLSDFSHVDESFYEEGCMIGSLGLQNWIKNTEQDKVEVLSTIKGIAEGESALIIIDNNDNEIEISFSSKYISS